MITERDKSTLCGMNCFFIESNLNYVSSFVKDYSINIGAFFAILLYYQEFYIFDKLIIKDISDKVVLNQDLKTFFVKMKNDLHYQIRKTNYLDLMKYPRIFIINVFIFRFLNKNNILSIDIDEYLNQKQKHNVRRKVINYNIHAIINSNYKFIVDLNNIIIKNIYLKFRKYVGESCRFTFDADNKKYLYIFSNWRHFKNSLGSEYHYKRFKNLLRSDDKVKFAYMDKYNLDQFYTVLVRCIYRGYLASEVSPKLDDDGIAKIKSSWAMYFVTSFFY